MKFTGANCHHIIIVNIDDGGSEMRTTITVEDDVMEKLMKYTKSKTRTEAVNHALADWVRHLKMEQLRALRGRLYMEDNWEKLRSMEIQENKATYGKRSR